MSGFSCVELVPLDMKWACACAGKRYVVHTHHDETEVKLLMEKRAKFLIEKKAF